MRRILIIAFSRMKLFFKRRFGIPRSIFVAILLAGLGYWILGLAGCAYIKETVKQFLAVSTKEIEEVRDQAIVRIVDCDYSSCYKKVQDKLTEIGSYIYAKRKDLIAVYISQTDTTPAGVFFRQIDKYKTELSIASPAKDTKEYLAEQIFSALEKKPEATNQ